MDVSIGEVEESRIKSFRSDISINLEFFSSDARLFLKDIWFDCASWDVFTKKIKFIGREGCAEATLTDMSKNLIISISDSRNNFRFILTINKVSVEGAKMDFVYEVPLAHDQVRHIEGAFSNFPRWW